MSWIIPGVYTSPWRTSAISRHALPRWLTASFGAGQLAEGPLRAVGEEYGIPAEAVVTAAGQDGDAFRAPLRYDFAVSVLIEKEAACGGSGIAEGGRRAGDPLGTHGFEHPFDQRAGEAVETGKIETGLFDDQRPADAGAKLRLPSPAALRG